MEDKAKSNTSTSTVRSLLRKFCVISQNKNNMFKINLNLLICSTFKECMLIYSSEFYTFFHNIEWFYVVRVCEYT